MKTFKTSLLIIIITSALSLSSCSIQSGGLAYDDIYYNPSDMEQYQEVESMTKRSSNYEVGRQNTYESNSRMYNERLKSQNIPDTLVAEPNQEEDYYEDSYIDYDEDDYYDYAYSARIRRFHSPNIWSSYYDDFYTNLYWYNYNPMSWGTSIYLGYSWWYPSYYHHSPHYFAYNHWGYSPWGYSYWGHSPYYYGWGYSPYYNNISYYNQRDRNSNFYRTRSSFDPNNGRRQSSGLETGRLSTAKNTRSFGEKYNSNNRSVANSRINNLNRTSIRDINQNKVGNRTNNPSRFNKPERIETPRRNTVNTNNRQVNTNNRPVNNRQINTNTRQVNQNANRRSINNTNPTRNSRTYNPPAMRQPRTNNQFKTNTSGRNINTPANTNHRQTSPRNISPTKQTNRSSGTRSSGGSSSGGSRSGGSRSGGSRR